MDDVFKDFQEEITIETHPLTKVLESAQLNINDKITRPPAVISIIENGKEIPFLTKGNISTIQGRAKSRKSFGLSMIIASYLMIEPLYSRFKGNFSGVCIWIDTEQGRYDVQRVNRRISMFADGDLFSKYFFCFALRPFTPQKRIELIEHLIYNLQKQGIEIGLLVIDGVRDLLSDINSPDESTSVMSKLMKWSDDLNCHISTVVHENKEGGKARGHIGTELINKSEVVLRVEKNEVQKDISVIKGQELRGIADFDDIYFSIDQETYLPYITNYEGAINF